MTSIICTCLMLELKLFFSVLNCTLFIFPNKTNVLGSFLVPWSQLTRHETGIETKTAALFEKTHIHSEKLSSFLMCAKTQEMY